MTFEDSAPAKKFSIADRGRCKGRFPFRLGTTSYILPDDILPNLRFLRDWVDDVELVLFESDEFSNMPSIEEVSEIAELGRRNALTYTVHLPLDTRLGSADEAERAASVGKCRRVVDLMAPADPLAYVLHLHGDRRGDSPSDDLARWKAQNRKSLAEILDGNVAPRSICVENIDFDFSLASDLVEDFDLSVCVDIGHLLLARRDVKNHLDRWFGRARIFHLHGVLDGVRDHVDIGNLPLGAIETLAGRLAENASERERVVTIEVFGENDFFRSMEVVQERLEPWLRLR